MPDMANKDKYKEHRKYKKSALFSAEHSFKWPSKQQEAREKSFRMGEYRTYRAQKGFWKSEAGQHEDM